MADLRPTGRYLARDRVRKRTEFLRIQQGGRRVVSTGFVFMLEQSAQGRGPRLGITASRRVGNAAERNRAKRLVREAFRAVRGSWPQALDMVVIVRQGLGNRKLGDVVAEWQAAKGRIFRRFAELEATSEASRPAGSSPAASISAASISAASISAASISAASISAASTFAGSDSAASATAGSREAPSGPLRSNEPKPRGA